MATTTADLSLMLVSGDRLSRHEFERRYAAMPANIKCELIEGVVYMAPPLRYEHHGKPHSYIIGWLLVYAAATPGVECADNTTVRLDLYNEVQPDALLRRLPEAGGQSCIGPDDYVEGAPELIAEVAASSASYDLNKKLEVYRRNGVQEYLVWRVQEGELDWFRLQDEHAERLTHDAGNVIESRVFPGLRLKVSALLTGNIAEVLAELQRGLGSPTHTAFARRLADSNPQVR
ncbi:MAG: Uma2 family endonuclease [Candidatus Competibacteraceae bacterium]